MNLKPWYKVVTPREDLREGRPLDASEFAVHLDHVRDRRAPPVYKEPFQFFERTFLTRTLTDLGAQVIRRLSGIQTETSAVFNLATQFGGGKTHALTLLYHLSKGGPKATAWVGVDRLLERAGVRSVPKADVAVFVGTEFDSITGRGGDDGTPVRKTPWGEIAFQLGGLSALAVVAEHESQMTAPAGDVIRRFLPAGRPCLILMDELMNYVSRYRKSGMAGQLYAFLQNLCEEVRARDNTVLAVSVPGSELEMNAEDQADYERIKKLLDRLGKAVVMSAESEASEIIRRRLFEWDLGSTSQDGKTLLSRDAHDTCKAYTNWVLLHRQQIPDFPVDHARDLFLETYPFHPAVISLFERKWQSLPRFQKTRGILRLLALWVSKAYQDGFKGAHRDPLIGLGTAPLEDPLFRAALLEQLGENRLESAITTDIAGKKDSHAIRLDDEAVDAISKLRLHRKIATSIFFESNGGQARAEATIPEIRLAVGEPDLDIGNIETALDALTEACYFLTVEKNTYRFSLRENLNKRFVDRQANIRGNRVEERAAEEIQTVFGPGPALDRRYFPKTSNSIPDRPGLTLAVLAPEYSMSDRDSTLRLIEAMTRECGSSSRTFKSAIVWCVAETPVAIKTEVRKLLAWEDISEESGRLNLDDTQKKQVVESLKKAQRDVRESVWRTYKNLVLLAKDNSLHIVDLGLVHSSAAESLVGLIVNRLRQDGDVEEGISPNFLTRNWPPALTEWSTKGVRDAFFAAPQFPRLLNGDTIRLTIAKGVTEGILAYVGKKADGTYSPFIFRSSLSPNDIEISDDVFVITASEAEKRIEPPRLASLEIEPGTVFLKPSQSVILTARGKDQNGCPFAIKDVQWGGDAGEIEVMSPGVCRLKASDEAGAFVVTARADEQTACASVTISGADVGPGPGPEPPPPPRSIRTLSWRGEIPAQKWMNFYTRVLTRLAGSKGLRVTIHFTFEPEEGISPEKIQETKVALRELGLNDDTRTDE